MGSSVCAKTLREDYSIPISELKYVRNCYIICFVEKWLPCPDIPTPRGDFAVTVLGDKVVAAGGLGTICFDSQVMTACYACYLVLVT